VNRKQACNYVWTITDQILEVVDNFLYLIVNSTYTGYLKSNVKILSEQAFKAYNSIL
jgi:hypothetical protein